MRVKFTTFWKNDDSPSLIISEIIVSEIAC